MGNFIQSDMGFLTKSPSPLDGKQEFATILEMKNFDTSWLGNTAMATCDEDGKLYVYNVNNTENDTTGKWRVVATGGGEGGASTADAVEYINDAVGSATVEEALNKLISDYYYVAPSINSFTASPTGGVFEAGTVITAPTFNWAYNKDITTQTLTDCTLADNTVRTATYNTDITTNKTFTLSANDGKNNVSKSISYTFVSPYYTGVSTTNTLTETDVKALTKKVETKGSKTINYTTSQSYMVFAYPSSYGAIKSVIDQNGFNVTSSFVQSTVAVNGVSYYVYVSNKCSGSYTCKFNY